MSLRHIIIGASAAGIAAANKIRQLDSEASIICISQESEQPYNKCFLADYLSGSKTQEQITIFTPEQALQKNITLLLGKKVQALKIAEKKVLLSDGSSLTYDRLLIATGTSPLIPQIPGIDSTGIFLFHGMHHAQALRDAVERQKPRHALIVGAGLSGLECADSLIQHGVEVTVVERSAQLLDRQITQAGSEFIEKHMQERGVKTYVSTEVKEIMNDIHDGKRVVLSNGVCLAADIVIFAVGARPNSQFLENADIRLHTQWILVDDTMQTSVPDICAAGDIVMVKDQLTGHLIPNCTWPDAMLQGMVAAHTMVGITKTYPGATIVTSSAFFGIKFASCGPVKNPLPEHESIEVCDQDSYKLFLWAHNKLCGFLIIAPSLHIGNYKRVLLTQQEVSKQQLLDGL